MTLDKIKIEAPPNATHYRINKAGNARYYRKDCSDNWIVYVDWRYPMRWETSNLIDNIKPLN
ncbi:hypothetical protein [Acinetobacter baumannii]|uniref:hypothetical protein n=1 Tax=Acinetobacter baumannii TaxID=470 RepID=UPI003D7F93D8